MRFSLAVRGLLHHNVVSYGQGWVYFVPPLEFEDFLEGYKYVHILPPLYYYVWLHTKTKIIWNFFLYLCLMFASLLKFSRSGNGYYSNLCWKNRSYLSVPQYLNKIASNERISGKKKTTHHIYRYSYNKIIPTVLFKIYSLVLQSYQLYYKNA